MKLKDKVALVTGTSPHSGIAEGLAAEGVKFVCGDIHPDNADPCAGD